MEEWRDIPGYENIYKVSELGRVMRVGQSSRGCMTKRGPHLLRPGIDTDGYRQFKLHSAPKPPKQVKVHQIVMAVFIGPPPTGLQINHKDRNKNNNSIANLEYVTLQRNIEHAIETGGRDSPRGECHGMRKITEAQAMYIKHSMQPQKELAGKFGIHIGQVSRIQSGKRWSYIQ